MANSLRLVLVKNALANVMRGGVSAMVALVVPPFLTRALPPAKYGAWVLVLQLAAYVGFLQFGIQTAVGRFVAHANERSDSRHRDEIVSTALALLMAACLGAMVLVGGLIAFLPRLFPKLPAGFYPDVRLALALVGGSLAIGLPASVFNGIFVGLQRYGVIAAIDGGSAGLSAVLITLIARHGGPLPAMALSVAGLNITSYVLRWLASRHYAADVRLSLRLVSRPAGRELAGYCTSLTIWSFCMLLISGLDLTLVGVFDFPKVGYYAVAATLVACAAGLQNYAFSAMMPSAAVLHARGASQELGRMVIDATRYGMFLLLLTGLPFLLAAQPILRLWVGPTYAAGASVLLQILVAANIVRLSAVPYVVTLIGTGQQRLVVLTPVLEGITNLAISVWAGYRWGAMGVALGTLCGAFVGIAGNFLYNLRRTREVRFSVREYAFESLLKPIFCVAPFALAWFLQGSLGDLESFARVLTTIIGGTASAWCFWRWGLVGKERNKIRSFAFGRLPAW